MTIKRAEKITEIFKNDPYANKLNMQLIEWEEGYAKTSIKLTEEMMNFHGGAHGGLLFSLADFAFAVASNSHGQMAVGINTNMSFTNAGIAGEELICVAKEKSIGGRLAVYQMEIHNTDGQLKGRMEGTVYRMRKDFTKKED